MTALNWTVTVAFTVAVGGDVAVDGAVTVTANRVATVAVSTVTVTATVAVLEGLVSGGDAEGGSDCAVKGTIDPPKEREEKGGEEGRVSVGSHDGAHPESSSQGGLSSQSQHLADGCTRPHR